MKTVQRTALLATHLGLCLIVTGCSLFGSRSQTLSVYSEPDGADVTINGEYVGKTPIKYTVSRSEDALIRVQLTGYESQHKTTNRTLSTLGTLDVIGGACVLVPFIGLASSASKEHEPDKLLFTLEHKKADGAK